MFCVRAFEGDDFPEVMDAQHDVYGDVVSHIVKTCWAAYRFAEEAVGTPEDAKLPGLRWWSLSDQASFDHRTVQFAHDVLAAAFRYRRGATVFDATVKRATLSQEWMEYAWRQIDRWAKDPFIVRAVVDSTQFANQPRGMAAERTLVTYLRALYELPPEKARADQ